MSVISAFSLGSVARFLGPPVLAGIVLTILAPLGTHNFGLLGRAVYWIGLCLAGGCGAFGTEWILARRKKTTHPFVQTLLLSFGATLAVSPFVLFGSNVTDPFAVALTLFYIGVIAVVITAVSQSVAHQKAGMSALAQLERPALMERLPLKLQDADLYAAVSEDHYVRIYTSKGDHMLLMRLADVPDLAQPLDGLSPHRSWWVAKAGVEEGIRQDGKLILRLKNGVEVPVSRAGAKRVREAGWLG